MMEQSGRQRATRIALDYHRQRDDLWRRRMAVAGVTLLLAVAYVAYGQFVPRGQMQFSHGPVADVHARWESDCQACHSDFRAIHARAWSFSESDHRALQKKCTTCHAGAGHHAQLLRKSVVHEQSCSACHRDHRGRDADLTRVADSACTDCHAQLDVVRFAGNAPTANTPIGAHITAFAAGQHPEFRSLKEDPGNVRFNHALHLLPGIKAPDSRDPGLTYGDIGEKYSEVEQQEFREQYRGSTGRDDQHVQLNCSSCHQLSGSTGDETNWHTARDRAYMQPVKYSTHCKACHVLDYSAGQTERIIPHGITLSAIRELVQFASAADATEQSEALDTAMDHLQRKCAKCHEPDTVAGPVHQVIAPPQRWLRHARFNHAAHTGTTCTTCHTQSTAVAQGGAVALLDGGTDQNHVMIHGVDVCLQCHGKSDSAGSIARADCVECHRYHVDPLDDPDYGASTNRLFEPLLPK